MIILVKPELDNVILVQDLCMVMENFGIEEDIDGITDGEGDTERQRQSTQPKEGKFDIVISQMKSNYFYYRIRSI
jgi:hypothetical protein